MSQKSINDSILKGFTLKLVFLFCLLFTFTLVSTAQITEIDSLKAELNKHKAKDTIRWKLVYDLAFENFRGDLEASKKYLKEAEELSNVLNYVRGKGHVLYLKGILENIQSNYPKSLDYFNRSLKQFKSINDLDGMASIHIAFGRTHFSQGQFEAALVDYNRATELYEKSGNKNGIIALLVNKASAYLEMGNYDNGISMFKKVLAHSKTINDSSEISIVNGNLGVIYYEQGNNPLALHYFKLSLDYYIKLGDSLGMAIGLNNLGDVYESMGKHDKALNYHKQSLKLAKQRGRKNLMATNYINIGNVYLSKKEYVKALKNYQNSLDLSQDINDLEQISMSYSNIGEMKLLLKQPLIARDNFTKSLNLAETIKSKRLIAYNNIGIAGTYVFEKRFDEALPFAKEGKRLAEELGLLEAQKEAFELLSEIYSKRGDYIKAFESYKKFKLFSDSLFNKENIEKITQIEYEYKYKQELEFANYRELKLTNTVKSKSKDLEKSQRNSYMAIIAILFVSLISGGIIFFLKLRNEKAKTQNIIVEQKLLRSQMTPHFIFNSLSVLQGMILNKEIELSSKYLSKFSKLLRTTLESSRHKTVPLSDEIVAIENYLSLQNLDVNPPYDYMISVPQEVINTRLMIPPMLIQPFIENAIEHAFPNQKENKEINLKLTFENKKLTCTIADNGIGISSEKGEKKRNKNSLATVITAERLNLLAKDFTGRGSLTIQNRKLFNERGTLITIVIPYKIEKV